MKLSARVEYGVRAMAVLAFHYREGAVPLKEIAAREGISYQFLEQIFPDLRKAGLIESVRGMRGGYLLARPPSEINVGHIVRAVEGPIAPVSCLVESSAGEGCCYRTEGCLTRHVWEKLRDRINEVLDAVNLADLIDLKPAQLIN